MSDEKFLIVNNVSKIYKSKDGVTVKALDSVSFTLPKNGFIFIVGKSGSGKSTLMNLLGALDKPTSGDVCLNGYRLDYENQSSLDAHRNEDVGFVFQDHELIEDFTVKENIAFSLQLQNKFTNYDEIIEVLKKVGLDGFADRSIKAISGGQRQRVAIARAIIKNPNLVLADEPTGNLDFKTGKQIFELLKEISKTRLVVMVTHDMDSAYKYGERIIELSDGKIVSDKIKSKDYDYDKLKKDYLNKIEESYTENKKSKLADENIPKQSKESKSLFPSSKAFNVAFNWVKKSMVLTILTVILLSFSIMVFGVFHNIKSYNMIQMMERTLQKNDLGTAIISKFDRDDEDVIFIDNEYVFTEDDIASLNSKLNTTIHKSISFPIVFKPYVSVANNGKLNFGYCLTGYQLGDTINKETLNTYYKAELIAGEYPQSNNEYVEILISDFVANNISKFGCNIDKNNFVLPGSSPSRIIGKVIEANNIPIKVVGIYSTMYSDLYKQGDKLKDRTAYNFCRNYIWPSFISVENAINDYVYNKKMYANYGTFSISTDGNNFIDQDRLFMFIDKLSELADLAVLGCDYALVDGYIKPQDTLLNKQLEKDEIILPLSRYIMLFGVIDLTESISEFNEIYVATDTSDEETIKYDTYKVVGVYDDTGIGEIYPEFKVSPAIVSEQQKTTYLNDNLHTALLVTSLPNDKETMTSYITTLYDRGMLLNTTATSKFIMFDALFLMLQDIITIAYFGFFGFVVLLMYIMISKIIKSKEKEIGILRAIGANKTDITKIFVITDLFYIVSSFILALVLYLIGIYLFNTTIASYLKSSIIILSTNFVSILLMLLIDIAIISVSTLSLTLKYSKMEPIKVIKKSS